MAIPPKLVSSSSSSFPTTARGSSEEGLANKLWIKFRRESIFAMYTPFVVCLAAGNLKIETFRHCISQDFHFLKAFAHAYKLAEECADDDDAKLAITKLRKGVLEELKMHNSFVQEWGIDPSKEETINSATVRYTDFLLATASGKVEGVEGPDKHATPFERTKVAAYTLGAMTPCMQLYAFLAKEFQALVDSEDGSHPYKKWIDNYSSEGIEAQPENQIARMSSAELRKAWVLLSGQYTEEYEQCIESILPPEKVEFNYEVLCKALEQLSDFERKANARVVESGVLKGLNLEDIKRAGERLILQDGCTSFFQKIVKNENLNANIHVVSNCRCADLIRSAFSSVIEFLAELQLRLESFW